MVRGMREGVTGSVVRWWGSDREYGEGDEGGGDRECGEVVGE